MRTNIGKEGKKTPYSSQNTRVAAEDSKSKCKICWCLDCTKNMKNTAEVCHAAGGAKPPKSTISNTKKAKGRPQSPKD